MRFIQREQKNDPGTPCAAEDSEGSEEPGFECTLYLNRLFQRQELWGFFWLLLVASENTLSEFPGPVKRQALRTVAVRPVVCLWSL